MSSVSPQQDSDHTEPHSSLSNDPGRRLCGPHHQHVPTFRTSALRPTSCMLTIIILPRGQCMVHRQCGKGSFQPWPPPPPCERVNCAIGGPGCDASHPNPARPINGTLSSLHRTCTAWGHCPNDWKRPTEQAHSHLKKPHKN